VFTAWNPDFGAALASPQAASASAIESAAMGRRTLIGRFIDSSSVMRPGIPGRLFWVLSSSRQV
jgi:hypothetical protein